MRGDTGRRRGQGQRPEGRAERSSAPLKPKVPRRRPGSKLTPAREAAYAILAEVADGGGYVHDIADRYFEQADMPREERDFALLLASGVLSVYGTLDDEIDAVLKHPDDIDFKLRQAFYISAYELFYLGKQPHAAVDQGVELVRWIRPNAAKFANFVLHRLAERAPFYTEEAAPALAEALAEVTPDIDPTMAEGRKALNLAAKLYGFPGWLLRRLAYNHGIPWAVAFAAYSNTAAPVFFAGNTARDEELESQGGIAGVLEAAGIEVGHAAFPVPGGALLGTQYLKRRGDVSSKAFRSLLQNGSVVVSDASAQAVAYIVLPKSKPACMLEIGSGRGIKTFLLQGLAYKRYGSYIDIDSVEPYGQKAWKASQLLASAGMPEGRQLALDATDLSELGDARYDVVFIDAPCSGTGTLRRHPEIRWELTKQDVQSLADLDLSLLREASRHVAAGGRLVYATCSVLDQENADVVRAFLKSAEGAAFRPVEACATPLSPGALEGNKDTSPAPAGASEGTVEALPAPDLHFCCVMEAAR